MVFNQYPLHRENLHFLLPKFIETSDFIESVSSKVNTTKIILIIFLKSCLPEITIVISTDKIVCQFNDGYRSLYVLNKKYAYVFFKCNFKSIILTINTANATLIIILLWCLVYRKLPSLLSSTDKLSYLLHCD